VQGIDKIALAGGEPFLNYPLLQQTVRSIRSKFGKRTEIELFTNGIFLYPERVEELDSLGAKIVVSLDGGKRGTDRHRVFRKDPHASVFDGVMENLKRLSPEHLQRMCASMTVTAETAAAMHDNVRFLREFGFGEVQVNMDILEIWSPRGMRRLKRGIKALKGYYEGLVRSELKSFEGFRFGLEYILLRWDEGVRESTVFKEVSLGPDGHFYPCGIVSTFGRRGSFQAGTFPFSGIRASAVSGGHSLPLPASAHTYRWNGGECLHHLQRAAHGRSGCHIDYPADGSAGVRPAVRKVFLRKAQARQGDAPPFGRAGGSFKADRRKRPLYRVYAGHRRHAQGALLRPDRNIGGLPPRLSHDGRNDAFAGRKTGNGVGRNGWRRTILI